MKGLSICAFLIAMGIAELSASALDDIKKFHTDLIRLLQHDVDSALILAEQAEELSSKEQEVYLQAKSLYLKICAYKKKGIHGESFKDNLKAIKLIENLSSDEAALLSINLSLHIGNTLDLHFAHREAIKYLNRGLKIAKKNGQFKECLQLYYTKAMTLRHSQDLQEALHIINLNLKLSRQLKNDLWTLRNLNQKGLILKDLKQYEEARVTYNQIINFPVKHEAETIHLGRSWHNIAITHFEEGSLSLARKAFLQALAYKRIKNSPKDLFITYSDLSKTLLNLDSIDEAYAYAQLCQPIYETLELDPHYYNHFNVMSEIAYRRNDARMVRLYAQKYYNENQKFLLQQKEILEIKDRYQMELLSEGFFAELEADENISLLEQVLWSLAIAFLCILLSIKLYSYLRKRSLSIAINQITEEGLV